MQSKDGENPHWTVPPLGDSLANVLFGAHFIQNSGDNKSSNAVCSHSMVITALTDIKIGKEILMNYQDSLA